MALSEYPLGRMHSDIVVWISEAKMRGGRGVGIEKAKKRRGVVS